MTEPVACLLTHLLVDYLQVVNWDPHHADPEHALSSRPGANPHVPIHFVPFVGLLSPNEHLDTEAACSYASCLHPLLDIFSTAACQHLSISPPNPDRWALATILHLTTAKSPQPIHHVSSTGISPHACRAGTHTVFLRGFLRMQRSLS